MANEVARYGDEIKEMAFACYLTAEGNVSRATRLLAEKLDGLPCPDRSVISRWAKEGQWGLARTQAVAEQFPYLNVEQTARMIDLADQALDTYESILAGEFDTLPVGIVQQKRAVAAHLLDLRGIGTSGAKYGTGELPSLPVIVQDDEAALSPQERQRRRLEAEREK